MTGSYEVDPQSLREFAWELQGQVQALKPPADRLAALRDSPLPLGSFPEAAELSERCRLAACQVVELIDRLRFAVAFAEAVTRAVADGYEEGDVQAAAQIRGSIYYSSNYYPSNARDTARDNAD